MKTTNKILIMSAVALAMAAVPNVKADGALLSPRARGNQIVRIVGTNQPDTTTMVTVTQNPGALLSPRARGNQIVKVARTNNDPDLVAAMQSLPGSPRAKSQESLPVYQIAPVK